MSPSELVLAIESAGGRLIPEADGRLLCERIPREFRPKLKEYKNEILALLQSREGAPAPVLSPATFGYKPRTAADLYCRAHQDEFGPAAIPDDRVFGSTTLKRGACPFCEHHGNVGMKRSTYCPVCRWDPCRVVFCICGRGEMQQQELSLTPEPAKTQVEHNRESRLSQQPKSRAATLVEIVTQSPNTYTVAELAEAAGRSRSWVCRTLRAAGLRAASIRRDADRATQSATDYQICKN